MLWKGHYTDLERITQLVEVPGKNHLKEPLGHLDSGLLS